MNALSPIARFFFLPILIVAFAGCGQSSGGPLSPIGEGGQGGSDDQGGEGGALGEGGAGGQGGDEPDGLGGSGGAEEGPELGSFEVVFADFCISCEVIRVGWTRALTVIATNPEGDPVEDLEVSWSTSKPSVVTVDESGLVRGVGVGSAVVTAAVGKWEASKAFTVERGQVAKIVVSPESVTLDAGDIATFEAEAFGQDAEGTILPDPLPSARIDWMVANPFVAEVVEPGMVRALGPGITWVIAADFEGIPGHEGHAVLEVTTEAPLPRGMEVETLSLGTVHGCAVAPGGVIHCWGRNDEGQLGVGYQSAPDAAFPTPGPIEIDPTLHFSTVASSSGSCGLDQHGKAWCWGNNMSGDLGLGREVPGSASPVPMAGDHAFTQITLGLSFGCALDEEQRAWCWGSNADGQVGLGAVGRDRLTDPDWEDYWTAWEPTQVVGDHRFVQIAAGLWSTCALDVEGKAWCWGENRLGALGNGDETVKASGEPVPVVGDHVFVRLALGSSHACGLTADGEAWCWGRNYSGQLGAPTPHPTNPENASFEPVRVQGDHRFTRIVTGAFHSCALDEDGAAWCWGNNEYGQSGSLFYSESIEAPVPVVGGLAFREIFAGPHHSCGITLDGEGYCWGDNLFGRLGLGYVDGLTPAPWPIALPE